MNRSEFLKRLGVIAVAIPLAPKIAAGAAELIKEETTFLDLQDTPPDVYPYSGKPFGPLEKPDGFDKMRDIYGHYEQPWIHDTKPWPLRMWDCILKPDNKTYVVTEVHYGKAILTPYDARDKVIIAHKGDVMIRIPNAISWNT